MRVVYYSRPWFLESSLHFVRALSTLAEVHFILEVAPENWLSAGFDVERDNLPDGLSPAAGLLERNFPPAAREFWRSCAGFWLAVHNSRQSLHPSTWNISTRVMTAVRRIRPDVVHLDDRSLRLALSLSGPGPAPVVMNIHDPLPHSGEPSGWRSRLTDALTMRRVGHYILFSEFTRRAFLKRYGTDPARVSVLRLGSLDFLRTSLEPGVSEEPRTVLFLGRISPYKGVEILLRAAAIVAATECNVRFVIAGKPIEGMEMPRAPSLGNGCTVTLLTRYVKNAEAAALLQSAAMLVCPYLDATQSAVVLTAYGFGKPVIASSAGALPEYVREGETGLLVPPGDDAALAAAIVSLLRNEHGRLGMKKAIERLNGGLFGWEGAAQEAMKIYRSFSGPGQR